MKKTLHFNNIILNKREFHRSKEAIDLFSVNVAQIVMSDKFKHDKNIFKHFIGYQKMKLLNHYALFYVK